MPQTKIKLGFAGTPQLAFEHFNELCSSETNDIKFVITQPSKPLGRGLVSYDRCAINDAVSALEQNDYRFSALIAAIVTSEPFTMRELVE